MKRALQFPVLGLALLGFLACHPAKPSRLKDEAQPQVGNPFPLKSISEEDTKTLAARIGYLEGDGSPENGKCIGCHQNFNNIDELDRLYGSTSWAFSCFDRGTETQEKAEATLNCLAEIAGGTRLQDITPRSLGFMAAGVEHKAFRDVFVKAGREAEYEDFKNAVGMPLGDAALSDKDFEALLVWVLSYYPSLQDFLKHDGPDVCRTAADTYVGSKVKDYVQRASEGGESWEYVNLSRGLLMFACPDSDKHNCFTQQKDGQDIFTLADQWKAPGLSGHIRILHQYDQYTSYWIRSSADGRFVGNGGSPSAIIDLQGKLNGGKARKIAVEAMYDPGFLPDNSGFIFQGDLHGSRICEQSILNSGDLVTIDFMQQGCSKSDLSVGLYQAIGNSMDSGDIKTIAGYFSSDDGYYTNRDIAPLFGKAAGIEIDTIRRNDASSFEKISAQTIPTPYHGSWQMSPANQLAVSIVSAAQDGKARHGGYRLFLMDETFGANNALPDWKNESSALLCTEGGEKPNISFDERMLAFYRYAKQDHRVASENSSSDIYVYDLLKGDKAVALTAMPKGFYAQFPHFRSDGWLYFTVYDANTDQRYIAATDVSIALAEAAK